ncbi:hypothetical protein [Tessaracoccus sp.]
MLDPRVATATQIEVAIRDSDIDYDAYDGYTGESFEQELYPLMDAIAAAELLPDDARPSLAMIWDDDATTSGGHVIIHLPNGLNLATSFIELRHMVTERDTVGMAALVDIAENFLGRANVVLAAYRAACR